MMIFKILICYIGDLNVVVVQIGAAHIHGDIIKIPIYGGRLV